MRKSTATGQKAGAEIGECEQDGQECSSQKTGKHRTRIYIRAGGQTPADQKAEKKKGKESQIFQDGGGFGDRAAVGDHSFRIQPGT